MSFLNGILGVTPQMQASLTPTPVLTGELDQAEQRDYRPWYEMLRAYYASNGLYDQLQKGLWEQGIWNEAMKPLRNPTGRAVLFYADNLWPGALPDALPIRTHNAKIIEPIHQLWEDSNWAENKDVFALLAPMLGDQFIKVGTNDDAAGVEQSMCLELIEPAKVVGFHKDKRGYLDALRLDVPLEIEPVAAANPAGIQYQQVMHTELWTKGRYRRWRHTQAFAADLALLGSPAEDVDLVQRLGIDFVPFVHVPFRDSGEPRGEPAIGICIDKINEANRQATRLHQMLFRHNKSMWAIVSDALDANRRPLAPPRFGNKVDTSGLSFDGDVVTIGDETYIRLPSSWKPESMVPQLDYGAALKILQDQMKEIEDDLPELVYYRMREMGTQLSGYAVQLLLMPAIKRALQFRARAETGLVRAQAMALTIGQNLGFWSGLGAFEQGDFRHSFAERAIIPLSDVDIANAVSQVAQYLSEEEILRRLVRSTEDIQRILDEREKDPALQAQRANAQRAQTALAADQQQLAAGTDPAIAARIQAAAQTPSDRQLAQQPGEKQKGGQ
jgi:hypothetical protein